MSDFDPPHPGSAEELECFAALQARLGPMFGRVFSDPLVPRTVLVIPSLSLDREVLARISGVHHYEERMLCTLMLLRLPRTKVIYVTSQAIDPSTIDYFLHMLPGIPINHAKRRLTLLSCHDASRVPLTEKILARPRLMQRVREEITDLESAHMTCFNVTALERTLAVQLTIPLYGCDPALSTLGGKSSSRKLFREAGLLVPEGMEDLRDETDLRAALIELANRDPELTRVVIKLNEGFSGEGNATFSLEGCPSDSGAKRWLDEHFVRGLEFEAKGESWESYQQKFREMGGIVEHFIEGREKRSPSVQCRINPLGEACIISTHDQVLGGAHGQIFLGCTFPADEAYRLEIQQQALRASELLNDEAVIGRYGIDFVSVRENTEEGSAWKHYAIEINLRKGGTTHPFMMLQFLTDGTYDPETGLYFTPAGRPRFYVASDNVESESYIGLTPEDLSDIVVYHGLHFHGATQQGVAFHLIGALSEFGKLGLLCIGDSPKSAERLYQNTIRVLDEEVDNPTAANPPI